MDGIENLAVTTADELATHYARPAERVLNKELDHIDALGRAFISASPFLVLATGGKAGLDCSPKGDQPGFVEVTDEGRTLLIPDRRGNNRLDGLKNIVEDPRVALIFFIPGANETYRVNGRARLSVDPRLRRRFAAPRRIAAANGATTPAMSRAGSIRRSTKSTRRTSTGWKSPGDGRQQIGRCN